MPIFRDSFAKLPAGVTHVLVTLSLSLAGCGGGTGTSTGRGSESVFADLEPTATDLASTPTFEALAARARDTYGGKREPADLDTPLLLDVTAALTHGVATNVVANESGELLPRAAFSVTGDDHLLREIDLIAHLVGYTGSLPDADRLDCASGHVDVMSERSGSLIELRLDFDACRDIPLAAFDGYGTYLDEEVAGDRSDIAIGGTVRVLARMTPRPGSAFGEPPTATRLEIGYEDLRAHVGERLVTVTGSELRARRVDCRGQTVRRSTLLIEDSEAGRAVLLDSLRGTLLLREERSERASRCNASGAADSFSGAILYADAGRVDIASPVALDLQHFVSEADSPLSGEQADGASDSIAGAFELGGREGQRASLLFHRRELMPPETEGYLSLKKIERSVSLESGREDVPVPLAHVSYAAFLAGALTDLEDADGDGLPNAWERVHGLNPDIADASSDTDDDGRSALVEFAERTDPTDAHDRGLSIDERLEVSVGAGRLRSLTDYSEEIGMGFDVTARLFVESETIAPEDFHFTLTLIGDARWADYILRSDVCESDQDRRVLHCDSVRVPIDHGRHGYGHGALYNASGEPLELTVQAIAPSEGPLRVVARLFSGPLDADLGNDHAAAEWTVSFHPVDFSVHAPEEIHGNESEVHTRSVEVRQLLDAAAPADIELFGNIPSGMTVSRVTVGQYWSGALPTNSVCFFVSGISCTLDAVEAERPARIEFDYELKPGTSGEIVWYLSVPGREDVQVANDIVSTSVVYMDPEFERKR